MWDNRACNDVKVDCLSDFSPKYLGLVREIARDAKESQMQGIANNMFFLEKKIERKHILKGSNRFWSYLHFVLNGYGMEPWKVLSWAAAIIVIFSVVFYFEAPKLMEHNYFNSLYFSTVTFTTLGYGDFVPVTVLMRILCAIEAGLGAILMAMGVACYMNKFRGF